MDVPLTAAALTGAASFLAATTVWPHAVLATAGVGSAFTESVIPIAAVPLYITLAALGETTPIGITISFAALCFITRAPAQAKR
jgi:hypothetical protein